MNNRVFSKWSGTFAEFSEFSGESLKHELGSVQGSALLPLSLWPCGIISVFYTGDPGSQPHNANFLFYLFFFVTEFRENSNERHKCRQLKY